MLPVFPADSEYELILRDTMNNTKLDGELLTARVADRYLTYQTDSCTT